MHIDKATLERHMTTITRQIELAEFLAECEREGRVSERLVRDVIPPPLEESRTRDVRPLTLFGSNTDRIRLVAVVLVAGKTIEEGFNLAFRYCCLVVPL